jgi:hypothetical protein
MAGKNTAVFGIYRDRYGVETAVDALREAGFRSTDISVLFPENWELRISHTKKQPKRQKGRQRVRVRGRSSAVP